MDKLNEQIEFLEMTESDPQMLVWLLELRRHRQENWKQRAEDAESSLESCLITVSRYAGPRTSDRERAEAAEAQLAELANRKPVGTVSITMDWNTHRYVATVNMRPDLVVSEMREGDELFTRPAPAAVPEVKRQLTASSEYKPTGGELTGELHGIAYDPQTKQVDHASIDLTPEQYESLRKGD